MQTNCVQGVAQPSNSFITGECSELNHYDRRLSNWRTLAKQEDIEEIGHQTEVIEAWPRVYVYCYPQTITLNNVTLPCPLFPIVLDAMERWNTSTFNYSPTAVELNTVEEWPLVRKVIKSVHLKGQPGIMPKTEAFNRIEQLYGTIMDVSRSRKE